MEFALGRDLSYEKKTILQFSGNYIIPYLKITNANALNGE
jgi:hypothetical protein